MTNLTRTVTESHIKEIFGMFGEVVEVELATDPVVSVCLLFGF